MKTKRPALLNLFLNIFEVLIISARLIIAVLIIALLFSFSVPEASILHIKLTPEVNEKNIILAEEFMT